ncbi:MAG: branched-chain amino acid ABC transporter permease [Candidatus Dormibacteraeota bacterium]|nr:branched-chain amino acid ABC transporter permease [Candidatus Dormibacteraeota bacterium]
MQLLLTQIFAGLVSGAILVLLALGLNLIFGFLEIINFSHGAFFAVGAYAAFFLAARLGSFWVGVILVPLGMLVLGAAVERVLIKPLYGRNQVDTLLLTFGLTFVVVELIQLLAGKSGKAVDPPPQLRFEIPLGPYHYPSYQVFVALLVAATVAGLWVFLERSSIGLIVRAGIRDNQMIRVLGVDFDRFRIVVFALGTALAGLAGVLISPITTAYPEMGSDILITTFVVVVVGGLGSYWGAVISGLVIGVLVSITSLYASIYAPIIPFVLMIVVMALRPRGLLGTA